MCSRLEELRQKMISTSQTNLDRVITKKEKEWQDRLREREQELVLQFQQQRQDLEVKVVQFIIGDVHSFIGHCLISLDPGQLATTD